MEVEWQQIGVERLRLDPELQRPEVERGPLEAARGGRGRWPGWNASRPDRPLNSNP
jgi:hypothetical protein